MLMIRVVRNYISQQILLVERAHRPKPALIQSKLELTQQLRQLNEAAEDQYTPEVLLDSQGSQRRW